MNIEELNTQIEYLKETKNLIKEQLIAKGQPVDDNTTFREYVDNMIDLIDTTDADAVASEVGEDKTAYVNGTQVVGNVPMVEADDYFLLNKTEKPDSGAAYNITTMVKNINDGTVNEIIMTDGQILDLSTLPEDITGKNVFIYWGTDDNFDRWGMFITDMDSIFCLSAHDNTYAMNCRDKATRGNIRDMSYYMGARTKTGSVDINNVEWGTKTVWNKQYLVEIYVLYSKFNVYATEPVYWGQFSTYSNIQFAGATQYRYYQDNKITYSNAGIVQKNSLLAKENSHIYTPIFTELLVQNEGITSNKIKAGESILGVQGSASIVNTSDANATTDDIVLNKTAYVNGQKLTGAVREVVNGSASSYIGTNFTVIDNTQYSILDFRLPFTSDILHRQGSQEQLNVSYDKVASAINLSASQIKSGETVLGIAGSVVELNGDTETVTPTTSQQIITPTSPKNAFTQVTVNAVTSAIDSNIQASNIKSGVSILGVNGSVIELNGETASVTPTTSQQTIVPTGTGKNALTQVTVNAVTSAIDQNIVAGNIKSGVTILGITGNYAGSTMKEYASEAAMNNDIENIDAQEIVKVVSGGVTTYYIKDGTPVTYQPLDLSTLATGDTISLKGMKINNEATSNIITGTGDSKSITFSNNGQNVLELEFHGGAVYISGSLTINGSTTYNYSGVTEGQNSTLSSADVEAINSNAIWNSDDLLTITKSYTTVSREIENAILEQVGGYSMVKLVKESETISPQEYQENIELADEILGEEE